MGTFLRERTVQTVPDHACAQPQAATGEHRIMTQKVMRDDRLETRTWISICASETAPRTRHGRTYESDRSEAHQKPLPLGIVHIANCQATASGGGGLGLTIAKTIAEGGRIEPGKAVITASRSPDFARLAAVHCSYGRGRLQDPDRKQRDKVSTRSRLRLENRVRRACPSDCGSLNGRRSPERSLTLPARRAAALIINLQATPASSVMPNIRSAKR